LSIKGWDEYRLALRFVSPLGGKDSLKGDLNHLGMVIRRC